MRLHNDQHGFHAELVRSNQAGKSHRVHPKNADAIHSRSNPDGVGQSTNVRFSAEATMASARSVLQSSVREKTLAMFQELGIDLEQAQGMDTSPEAVAKTIFDFSTGLLDVFRDQHPELSESELIDAFESTIRGAVQEGYDEAIEILQAMDLDDDVLSTAADTKSILDGMFDEFFAGLREAEQGETPQDLAS